MHLTIITIGTRGDVLPYLALGLGLQRAGYRVRIAAQGIYAGLIESHGFEFAPVAGDPRATMESQSGQAWQQSGRNALALIKSMRAVFAGEDMTASLNDTLKACEGTQAILYAFFGTAGYHIARKLGVPSIFTLLQPFSRSHEVPSLGFPDLPLGRCYNGLTHRMTEQMLWQLGGRPINRWRQESLGLPALPASGPFAQVYREGEPHLYGFSRHVVPLPSDWPPSHRISGYWFLDPDPDWEPPETLRDFLAQGPKPIAIGFGSMSGETARAITRTALEAVRLAGTRAVLLGGWAAVHRESLPDGVLALDYVPHPWLFPRVAAVVHHGGAGTTAAGLRAGVPSVLVPFFGDQPYWGRRVRALGVGPRPVQARQLNPERLARAISDAIDSPEIASAAAALGERIRAEDGVARAVELVGEMLK
ncbi:MAG: glycosyltransferase [Anaerolineales bacterium]